MHSSWSAQVISYAMSISLLKAVLFPLVPPNAKGWFTQHSPSPLPTMHWICMCWGAGISWAHAVFPMCRTCSCCASTDIPWTTTCKAFAWDGEWGRTLWAILKHAESQQAPIYLGSKTPASECRRLRYGGPLRPHWLWVLKLHFVQHNHTWLPFGDRKCIRNRTSKREDSYTYWFRVKDASS